MYTGSVTCADRRYVKPNSIISTIPPLRRTEANIIVGPGAASSFMLAFLRFWNDFSKRSNFVHPRLNAFISLIPCIYSIILDEALTLIF